MTTETNDPLILKFSPTKMPLWLHIITFALLGLFLLLSFWQAKRGLSKQAIINQVEEKHDGTGLNSTQLITDLSGQTYSIGQPVTLTGKFENQRFFLLENKMHQGKIGFDVIQPFLIDNNLSILVNRGWIPRHMNKDGLLAIAPVVEIVTIGGQLYRPTHNVFITQNIVEEQWPQQALEINPESFAKRLDTKLFPMVVNLHNESPYSFVGPLPIGQTLSPQRHYGYSAQWLCFALILASIWIYKLFRQTEKS